MEFIFAFANLALPLERSKFGPLPKEDIPVHDSDYRGINVTPIIARVLKTSFIVLFASANQFAYREGGSWTDALLYIQHTICGAQDDNDTKAVRLFAMDFSKAFDSVSHYILSEKLKTWPLNPFIINWYINFLKDRKQRVVSNGMLCDWKHVNRGTTQGSVSGPYLFNIFLNDLNLDNDSVSSLVKYADDSTIVASVKKDEENTSTESVQPFLDWTNQNSMTCNSTKCKEMIFRKKGNLEPYSSINNIMQCNELKILGVTFQSDCRFICHIRQKLIKANKCLFVLRSLRKEGYSQKEIDYLFNSIVLPNVTYGLSIYAASSAELTTVQCFLERCFRRKYTSKYIDVYSLLENQDKQIFIKVKKLDLHPMHCYLPKSQPTKYNLRSKHISKPKINTERFKDCYINRLIFRYNLALDS